MIDVSDPYFLYMAEAEGMTNLVNTHTAYLNAVIKDTHNYPSNYISYDLIYRLCRKHGFDPSDADINYIIRNR